MSEDVSLPPKNGAVLNISTVINTVMSLVLEAELGALFLNAKAAVIRKALKEMGHPQPPMPVQWIIVQHKG